MTALKNVPDAGLDADLGLLAASTPLASTPSASTPLASIPSVTTLETSKGLPLGDAGAAGALPAPSRQSRHDWQRRFGDRPNPPAQRKFVVPPVGAHVIIRERLIAHLTTSESSIATVIAPPGDGKTTLLAAWAARQQRRIAWICLDETDNDAAVLLADIAFAVDNALELGGTLNRRMSSAGSGLPATNVRAFLRSVEASETSFALVLDDAHLLRDPVATDILAMMALQLPLNAQLVISARAMPPIPLARPRVAGRLVELGVPELAMDDAEALLLLRNAGLNVSADVASGLNDWAEGWPAGLYLAALALRKRSDRAIAAGSLGAADELVTDYVREEILAGLPDSRVRFLTRSAILERPSPALCDAVVGTSDSAAVLAQLATGNRFVVPIDAATRSYRYHAPFRHALLAELARREPDELPSLHLRAACWLQQHGRVEEAIEHAHAAGATSVAGELVCDLVAPYIARGRIHSVVRLLEAFDDDAIRAYPPLAVYTAVTLAFLGDPAAVSWLQRAEQVKFDGPMPGDAASFSSMISFARALLAPHGVNQMLTDATDCLMAESAASPWYSGALVSRSIALLLAGRTAEARDGFEQVIDGAGSDRAPSVCVAQAELGLLATEAGEWDEAAEHAALARATALSAQISDDASQILTFALVAELGIHNGDPRRSREALAHAHVLRSDSTITLPWLGVQARIVMARVHQALGDLAGARTVVKDAQEIQRRRPDLGTLNQRLGGLDSELRARTTDTIAGTMTLSTAELRVLAYLPTHLTFREISQRLFVSPNTVKSQAISIYRKLGVSSRSEALRVATACGLLES
ncbi:LuxR family maltose regulon positive regulatory protein [Jatrophihabitans sp. GAS493]|uniref:LuxR family transcriptional regulator n=1 Tax=Jatrophihabitans sp. GAS493 TaxID=1907575 RepID=UPI000BC01157|nr:LuxR family transcriptional regulator [Jatrophihabitans sp. GAS493]SOD74900.1 LuxR family maltose regulon positive regulatory protein [Jatrophihabitans sp. GAS493]